VRLRESSPRTRTWPASWRNSTRGSASTTRSSRLSSRPSVGGQQWSGEGRGIAPDLDSSDWKSWVPNQSNQAPLPASVLLRLESSKLVFSGAAASPDRGIRV
jgi:hypothetical protein